MEKIENILPQHGRPEPSSDWDADQQRCDTWNNSHGNLTGYDCPKCMNRGNFLRKREGGGVYVEDCSCKAIRSCIAEMERSGLKEGIREMTFEAFKAETSWQKTLKDGAMKYAANPEGWLLFCGQSGSGKPHLCTAVSRSRLYAGAAVRYMPWRDKVAELKGLSLDAPRRGEIISAYKNAELLFLDDLFKTGRGNDGTSRPTAADIGLAFEIINHRYINHLSTVVSKELTPQELVGIDEALGSRIIEAAGGNVFVIGRDIGRNYRLRNIQCV